MLRILFFSLSHKFSLSLHHSIWPPAFLEPSGTQGHSMQAQRRVCMISGMEHASEVLYHLNHVLILLSTISTLKKAKKKIYGYYELTKVSQSLRAEISKGKVTSYKMDGCQCENLCGQRVNS